MHDAEVAVTLINRYGRGRQCAGAMGAVKLLREGHLECHLVKGAVALEGDFDAGQCALELLEFEDGSRALRLLNDGLSRATTPWVAMPPLAV